MSRDGLLRGVAVAGGRGRAGGVTGGLVDVGLDVCVPPERGHEQHHREQDGREQHELERRTPPLPSAARHGFSPRSGWKSSMEPDAVPDTVIVHPGIRSITPPDTVTVTRRVPSS